MTSLIGSLIWLGRRGPWVLITGLVAGVGLPDLAHALRPYLSQMVVMLLFLAALRVDPVRLRDMRFGATMGIALVLQMGVPLGFAFVGMALGLSQSPYLVALILMAAAPSISGSPNMSLMLGHDPTPALHLLVVGTAILPATATVVFFVVPGLGDAGTVATTALTLLVLIGASAFLAQMLRKTAWTAPSPQGLAALDGVSAIALAIFVIGLMADLGQSFASDPGTALVWLALAFAGNFGLQIAAHQALRNRLPADRAVPLSLVAGNRNIALFLVALPPEVITPLLLFIGCYQVPMYLTPLIMGWIFKARAP